jgi:hypothetical protein
MTQTLPVYIAHFRAPERLTARLRSLQSKRPLGPVAAIDNGALGRGPFT